ncbi:ParB N-terminal domain-containing protein [Parageobacillus sp. VR-IP]|uniref:ParB N-terminal domain-containing protein n=1 Tax=Parageobacillus sp. VR-IP TaxID=2742205 RepID=UPI001582488C|nr:ParB N-terminal domain-containing protein [Parageobacillus sp. VR-IP]NUK30487.1 ParB N-terminal domain-containing protein [Parageobacillus sp. VR-IP]
MKEVITSLKLVPINQLRLHEEYEPSRLEKTITQIRKDQFLRHPILVTKLNGGSYLVLDGVHRLSALRAIGCRKVPVQEVEKKDFSNTAWNHLISTGEWYEKMLNDSSLPWVREEKEGTIFVEGVSSENKSHFLYLEDIQSDLLAYWHTVVSYYSKQYPVIRIPKEDEHLPPKGYVLIKYQPISYEAIEAYVTNGWTLPAGVTRFIINGRLLNLKVPLALLMDQSENIQEWMRLIEKWEKSLRFYKEQVYLCEI